MELGLKGKVAVVTGGSQGIGKATALRFAKEGANVAICARNADRLEQASAELRKTGVEVLSMSADCSKPEDIEKFIGAVVKKFGRIDVLVNNAGESQRGKFLETDDAKWSSDIELKVFGAIRCSRLAIPHMKKQGGGRIINLNMVAAKQPGAAMFPTTVSRAAGLALTKGLSKELAPFNILVNAVAVGKIKSRQQERSAVRLGLSVDEHYAKTGKTVPMGRMGESEEVANVIAFLASDASSYVTGTCINVDGGLSGVL
jgi:NAD(P)-dependent dehydrogenase (short-subunit alcohol dehydrogenase family)